MDVIIISRGGVLDTPLLIEHETTAECEFDNLCRELFPEFDAFSNEKADQLDELNEYLQPQGIEVRWFTNVDVNDWDNNYEYGDCHKCGHEYYILDNPDRCPNCLTSH